MGKIGKKKKWRNFDNKQNKNLLFVLFKKKQKEKKKGLCFVFFGCILLRRLKRLKIETIVGKK